MSEDQQHGHAGRGGKRASAGLALAALGIVYGDIGTSPLYALRETFEGHGHELPVTEANVLGVLSLIFWSLVAIICVKYLAFVMRADNEGEGGILALTSLLPPLRAGERGGRWLLVLVGLFGTALLYGDGMITPAISVLAAVEGTAVSVPGLHAWVVPIAVVILVGLFAIQSRGTATIGRVFGPVMLVWFTTLAVLGLLQLIGNPGVLRAVNPAHAARFFAENGFPAFLSLGSVFLVVTGGEALYADMGHFGRGPIALGWFTFVFPALLLNYFGQGALLISRPEAISAPFYQLVPSWAVLGLVALATVATVIASQALISGLFSLTLQAVQLDYVPRMRIDHTSPSAFGQIYIPAVNWSLLIACVGLVIGFGSSSALAAAYGVAVTATMVITTVLFAVVVHERYQWPLAGVVALAAVFLVLELGFFGANLFKIPAGGWFPLVIGAVMFTLLTTWNTGRRLVRQRIRRAELRLGPYAEYVGQGPDPVIRIPGTAVYLFGVPDAVPPAMVANVRHHHTLHERVFVVSVLTDRVPVVATKDRAEIVEYGHGVTAVRLHFGFFEDPDVPSAMTEGAAAALKFPVEEATYFTSAERLRATKIPGMARWREHLFALMHRNSTAAAEYFWLPADRSVIVGASVDL